MATLDAHSGLRIENVDLGSNEIENTNWGRSVGERVNIQAAPPWTNDQISNCSWGLPNASGPHYAVGGYGPFAAPPPSVMPSPSPMPTLGATGVSFYWVAPFADTPMNVTCTESSTSGVGDGGKPLSGVQLTATVTVHVVAPTWTIEPVLAAPHVGASYDPNNQSTSAISLGTQESPLPANAGLYATYNVTMPTYYGGFFGPTQRVEAEYAASPGPAAAGTNDQYYLDGCAIYPTGTDGLIQSVPFLNKGQSGPYQTVDSPGVFPGANSTYYIKNAFITTLMFKPTVGPPGNLAHTIWVPLESFTWSFEGTGQNQNGNWTWASGIATPSPNPTQDPASGTYISNATPRPKMFNVTPDFPTWSNDAPLPTQGGNNDCPSVS